MGNSGAEQSEDGTARREYGEGSNHGNIDGDVNGLSTAQDPQPSPWSQCARVFRRFQSRPVSSFSVSISF
jgi:hypothetical protein